MHWDQILTVFAVIVTNLGTVIGLYLHTDSKMENHRKDTHDILEGIRQEMKEFHGRMCAIEERNKNKN